MLKGMLSTEHKNPLGIYLYRFIWLIYVCIHKHWGMNAWRYVHLCAMRLWHWPCFKTHHNGYTMNNNIWLEFNSKPSSLLILAQTDLYKLSSLLAGRYFDEECSNPSGLNLGLPQKQSSSAYGEVLLWYGKWRTQNCIRRASKHCTIITQQDCFAVLILIQTK